MKTYEKTVSSEKVYCEQVILFVAVPKDNLDGRIYPAAFPRSFIDGEIRYTDGSTHIIDESWREIQAICTDPERKWANENIVAWDCPENGGRPTRKTWEDYNISPVHMLSDKYNGAKANKANDRIMSKLACMTAREYYQSKWRRATPQSEAGAKARRNGKGGAT